MGYNVLLIGNGGREHAIASSLSGSTLLDKLYISPGNPGTAALGENVKLKVSDFEEVWNFIQDQQIDLTIIGPEKPLVDGIVNFLSAKGHPVFGPKLQAAMLEGSKEFAKEFMHRHSIPTAAHKVFLQSEFEQAEAYLKNNDTFPIVLKADGLAGGKGVFIAESEEEAMNALQLMRSDVALSDATSKLIVEEFMPGEEASVFAISDGEHYKIMGYAQDHKRISDGDKGPNTGGMGAYSPAPVITSAMLSRVEKEIIRPTVEGMKAEGNPYVGILYCGLMITDEGPKVVEYNCRFGDPECQVILPRLKSDLLELIIACSEKNLDKQQVQFDDSYTCCVVLVSGGYPKAYEKGKEIKGLDKVRNVLVFHAGTRSSEGILVSDGGRVLNIVGKGNTLSEAIEITYSEIEKISFDNAFYRNDIGVKGLKYTQK